MNPKTVKKAVDIMSPILSSFANFTIKCQQKNMVKKYGNLASFKKNASPREIAQYGLLEKARAQNIASKAPPQKNPKKKI